MPGRLSKTAWDREHTTQLSIKLNNKQDADILAKLQTVKNRQGYIKMLIREDITRSVSN